MTQFLIISNNLDYLNYLTMKIINILEFITSSFISSTSLIYLLINFTFEGLIIITIIYLASRAPKVLDTASKVVTISTGGTVLYNNWVKDSSSGSNDDKDDKDENKKDENKKDENKKDENIEDKPKDNNKSNEK